MRYDFSCPRCEVAVEVILPMARAGEEQKCKECDSVMQRDFSGINVSKGHKQYHRPIVSDSMAMNPEQIPEHRRLFPNIQVTPEGQPVFDNYTDHENYLNKCNIVKGSGKKKKRGKRIA
jgi:putative FmdB family regulatory protein